MDRARKELLARIENELEYYNGQIEEDETQMRRSPKDQEDYYWQRIHATIRLVAALRCLYVTTGRRDDGQNA